MTKPFAYQTEDVEQIERWGGRALLAHEMGCGKTLISLLYAQRNPDLRPIVVACPASLKWHWEGEAKRHIGMRAEVLEGTKPHGEGWKTSKPMVVLNYDILPFWLEYLKGLNPQLVILDEVHYISNPFAKRSKAAERLCLGVPHILELSGTPITNRPWELWMPLHILKPTLFPNRFAYGVKYCGGRRTYWGWDFRGASRLPELHKILNRHVMIRRRQEDVLKFLPSRQKIVIPVQLEDRSEYDEALHNFRKWMLKRNPLKLSSAERAQRLTQMGYLKQLVGAAKLPYLTDWVEDFLEESDRKLVLFVVHRKVIAQLKEKFPDSVAVYGGIRGRERQRAVDKFQKTKRCRLFIGQIKAAGEGLNLTAANTVAFGEYPWTPGALSQAAKRTHRIGQEKKCFEYYHVAKDTIEERLLNLIEKKQETLNSVLDNGRGEEFNLMDQLAQELLKGEYT